MIDRLLESPHYGERMAAKWLDIARYSDSHGFQDDAFRDAWPWRDWVIEAYNDNLPYDDFLTWQIAGDLLAEPTQEQLIATGFNRNHAQTSEGGVIDEEYRVEYVSDRTNTFGQAFLGLTMECARCHDHKYDAITQRDYYSLFAYFNNINEHGISPYVGQATPSLIVETPDYVAQRDELQAAIDGVERELLPEQYVEDLRRWVEGEGRSTEPIAFLDHELRAHFRFEEEEYAPEWARTHRRLHARAPRRGRGGADDLGLPERRKARSTERENPGRLLEPAGDRGRHCRQRHSISRRLRHPLPRRPEIRATPGLQRQRLDPRSARYATGTPLR